MKTLLLSTVVTLILGLSASNSNGAGDIVQSQMGGALNITGFAPIGQTFTATSAEISTIGFKVTPANTANSTTLFLYQLREGAGLFGPVVATPEFQSASRVHRLRRRGLQFGNPDGRASLRCSSR